MSTAWSSRAATGPAPAIVKYDPTGKLLWAKTTEGDGDQQAAGLAVNASGQIVIGGGFIGNVIVGTAEVTGDGQQHDAFVVMLDSDGNGMWAKAGVGPGNDGGSTNAVAIDAKGSVTAAGSVDGSIDFGFQGASYGSDGVFVVRFDAKGGGVWAAFASAASAELSASGVAADDKGGAYVTGQIGNPADFGGVMLQPTATGRDAFVVAYDKDGHAAWGKHGGVSNMNNAGNAIAFDGAGALYVTGQLQGPAVFDGVTLDGSGGVFVARYGLDGALGWAVRASRAAARATA